MPTTLLQTGVRAVITDLAGTIVDFGCRAPAEAFTALFAEAGVPITEAEARAPMGLHKRAHLEAILAEDRPAAAFRERHGRDAGPADIDRLFERFVPTQMGVLRRFSTPIAGALEALGRLGAAGVRIGATTGYDGPMIEVVMEALRPQGFHPDCVLGADDVPVGRPAPYLIWRAMEALAVYPPRLVVAVGDTTADMEAARNAGVWAVATAATGNLVGLDEAALAALPARERFDVVHAAREALHQAGAHVVLDAASQLERGVAEIERRIAAGERP